ncbi:helix-turn-helix transcriptional regulator [Roseivivax sediminis]|uniref:DNA binding domain-containing protein, excisionase family n=1 Tax=Roseivivax sediminis TaxID=936889 RepID=A0A1I1W5A2_9RHOB|nr:helix-turn-helix transcriptional regulator [Roseivivax sediminis]SFD90179.1 DNA binding domain-containing protein, excisionase family [Roseivivax sediminis]
MTEITQPEYLTVRELADLLRIKERKVYDLAGSGQVPCSKVTGKLLFPAREVRAWIAAGALDAGAPPSVRPAVFLGSHDPLLDWALRQAQTALATYFDGSGDGLTRFAAGEGVATGLHLFEDGAWNVAAAQRSGAQNAVLIGFAKRTRGLALSPDSSVQRLADIPGRRIVPRQGGSGTESVFDHLLSEAGLERGALDLAPPALSESDAVTAVQQGAAEVTFGLGALAAAHGLRFVPLIEERFDLLIDRKAYFDPGLQRFFAFCRGQDFRDHADRLGGYDVSETGAVRWNG